MAGEHRCSVCQATFTRPQHVARHMRSHTGDRPYQCQLCHDQFARSDLLSRHVNKCHAHEKPPPTAGNTRRKGSASGWRATTSKQACDQCVQSNMPCDGCNPCAKCVQRKTRCTFVKFHRQTAPVGPGHNPRPTPTSLSTSGLAATPLTPSTVSPSSAMRLYPHVEEPHLEPSSHPPNSSMSTMPDTLYASQGFAFPQLYSQQQSQRQPDPGGIMSNDPDFMAKYRARAELLAQSGGLSMEMRGMYPAGNVDRRPGSSSSASPPASSPWMTTWPSNQMPVDPYRSHHIQERELQQADYPHQMMASARAQNPNMQMSVQDGTYQAAIHGLYELQVPRDRRTSMEFSSSEGSTSHSVPSSATSSTLHLPIEAANPNALPPTHAHPQRHSHHSHHHPHHQPQSQGAHMTYNNNIMEGSTSTLVAPTKEASAPDLEYPRPSQDEGRQARVDEQHPSSIIDSGRSLETTPNGSTAASVRGQAPASMIGDGGGVFPSTFGLMTLEEANNVLAAASAVDNVPFFDTVPNENIQADPNATPMPPTTTIGSIKTSSPHTSSLTTPTPALNSNNDQRAVHQSQEHEREKEREREMWKQYLCTPPDHSPVSTSTQPSLSQSLPTLPTPSAFGNRQSHSITPPAGSQPQWSLSLYHGVHRRPRLASYPSGRIPSGDIDRYMAGPITRPFISPPHTTASFATPRPALRTPATAVYGCEQPPGPDLSSYEAAILARPTPQELNLGPRAKARARQASATVGAGVHGQQPYPSRRPRSLTSSPPTLTSLTFTHHAMGERSPVGDRSSPGGSGGSQGCTSRESSLSFEDAASLAGSGSGGGYAKRHDSPSSDAASVVSSSEFGGEGYVLRPSAVKRMPEEALESDKIKRCALDMDRGSVGEMDADSWLMVDAPDGREHHYLDSPMDDVHIQQSTTPPSTSSTMIPASYGATTHGEYRH